MKTGKQLDQMFERIAQEHLGIETLEIQDRDRFDFHDVSVWRIKAALQAAFDAGHKAGMTHQTPTPSKPESTMTTIQLTPSQQAILDHAHQHTEGKIEWFPENIKGGARQKVIDGLLNRKLITMKGKHWLMTATGYEALGVPRKAPVSRKVIDTVIATATEVKPRTRDNSKQAQVVAMLKRPEGATIPQICEATGWQSHTVRGTFAGAFKKKLGLAITSTKETGGERIYRAA